ncbi:hypothetical protein KDAU_39600 [Dictyobacter aurantiacus]|uniref:Uncharacterized protein n=1 Tax=Dictyobacter aurantiacus TaxID=1936993 RepID=A0A401ZIE3_9CHLR|nr:hypothetical protein KDAU_39600 [Dictyobacter aurantiacus]
MQAYQPANNGDFVVFRESAVVDEHSIANISLWGCDLDEIFHYSKTL